MKRFASLTAALALGVPGVAQADVTDWATSQLDRALTHVKGADVQETGCASDRPVTCYAMYNLRKRGWYVEYRWLHKGRFLPIFWEVGCPYKATYLNVKHPTLDFSYPQRTRCAR